MTSLRVTDRAAFRALLRTCRQVDRHPEQRLTLFGRPPRRYNPQDHSVARSLPSVSPFLDDAIWEVNGRSTEFSHPRVDGLRAASLAVRRHCSRASSLGLPYTKEAQTLHQQLGEAQGAFEVAKTAELTFGDIVQQFRSHLAQPAPSDSLDANEDENDLWLERISSHDSAPVRVGEFLITHPLSCIAETSLDRAVILISEIDVGHIRGMMVNSQSKLGTLQRFQGELSMQAECWEHLLELPLGFGGQLSSQNFSDGLRWLHVFGRQVPDAVEVAPSIWLGGDLSTAEALVSSALKACKENPDAFRGIRPVIGYAGWARTQLALELERGVWVRCRAVTPDAARRLCMPDLSQSTKEGLWLQALRGAGCAAMAAFPRGTKPDEGLKRLLEAHHRKMSEEFQKAKPRTSASL